MAKDLEAITIFGGDDADVFITLAPDATYPTALEDPGADFADLGWLSEEGVTLGETPEQNDFFAHQGGALVASVILREEKTLRIQCLESTAKQAGIYWSGLTIGENASDSGVYGGTVKGAKSRSYGLIVDDYSINQFLDSGEPVTERYVIHNAVLSEKEELAFRRDGIRMWGFTFKIIGEYDYWTNNPKMAPENAIPSGAGTAPAPVPEPGADPGTVTPTVSGAAVERLRALKAFGAGKVRVAVVGDSTGNADGEWVRLWSRKFGSLLPSTVQRTYKAWNGTSWIETVDAEVPGLIDTFTRTGAVTGSTPDQGPVWSGVGSWAADGGKAVLPLGSPPGAVVNDLGGSIQSAKTILSVVTKKQAATRLMRIYTNTSAAGNGLGVWLTIWVNTTGVLSASLNKTVAGGATTTLSEAQVVAGQVYDSATPLPVDVTITISGDTVTATTVAAGQTTTWTGTLAAGDTAGFGTRYSFGAYGETSATDPFPLAVDQVEVTSTAANTFEIWNGSISGATPETFDATLRDSQFGENPFEIVVLNFGHNGSQTGEQFVTTISDWLAAWATEHPESVPLLMSQNPQKAPSAGITYHAARLAALRSWAAENRHPYVPIWETFRARTDGGASLILADGVHPTMPPGGDLTGDYGSVLWADTVLAATV